MFAIVDCNNFYASCERLFRPDLKNKPIVILSNNDGCVISRSNEAKALGVKMGEPFFKVKSLIERAHIQVFSSNFSLYGDLSHRVMSVIEEAWPDTEIYSIDEAFLDLTTLPQPHHHRFCHELQEKILRHTGIPTSIGIGPSKTLAKAANVVAKKKLNIPVFDITYERQWLKDLEVSDVWGIGRKFTQTFNDLGIKTAEQVSALNAYEMKKQYNIMMMRTVLELQGTACSGLRPEEQRQSILSSRSFGQMHTELTILQEAISSHVARVCQKARSQHLVAKRVIVFVKSNRFRKDLQQYTRSMEYILVNPSNDTRVITKVAKQCLEKLYIPGIFYKKVGVTLVDLMADTLSQPDLFDPLSEEKVAQEKKLMGVMDDINRRFNKRFIVLGSEGYGLKAKGRSEMLSPCYTTQWADLLQVK